MEDVNTWDVRSKLDRKEVMLDVNNVNMLDVSPSTNLNHTLNPTVYGEGRGGLENVNPIIVDVNTKTDWMWDVRCRMSEDRTCTKHHQQLVRRKSKVRHWGVTSKGTARWSYRLEDNWHCIISNFKALPNLPGQL